MLARRSFVSDKSLAAVEFRNSAEPPSCAPYKPKFTLPVSVPLFNIRAFLDSSFSWYMLIFLIFLTDGASLCLVLFYYAVCYTLLGESSF